MLQQNSAMCPVGFEINQGQIDANVRFLSRLSNYTLFLTNTEAIFSFGKNQTKSLHLSFGEKDRFHTVTGLDELPAKANYLTGANVNYWVKNVPIYGSVKYSDVFPGIDVIFYGNDSGIEWDLIVAPGADPTRIAVNFKGADQLTISETGDLLIQNPEGQVVFKRPLIYQQAGEIKNAVAGEYLLLGNQQIGFVVEHYDRTLPLVIDPSVTYASYLGGSGSDQARQIAIDHMGYMYVVGSSYSTNFPTATPYQAANAGDRDVTITKLSPDGSTLVFATYLGGSGDDFANGLAVDTDGNVYVCGRTNSTNFPTQAPLQAANAGDYDIFIAKLNPTGSSLVFSTYIGGTGYESAEALALDSSNNIYVAGSTQSTNFPTLNAYQSTYGGGSDDGFILKINTEATSLAFSTYLGGSSRDTVLALDVDEYGSVYVTGDTESADFPTLNAIQPFNAGGRDAFVAKLNLVGALQYSTYLGGSGSDGAWGIAVNWDRSVLVTGQTNSLNFPVLNAYQPMLAGGFDAFLTKISTDGSQIIYSTYFGGSLDEESNGITVDSVGYVYLTGNTHSPDFPLLNPIQSIKGAAPGESDCTVTMFDIHGSLRFSTFLGGTAPGGSAGLKIAVDDMASVYISGETHTANFPVVSPYQATIRGDKEMFIAKLNLEDCCKKLGKLAHGVKVRKNRNL